MRAHLVQFDIVWENRQENFRLVQGLVSSARPAEHDLILLPEMFDSGFSLNTQTTADNLPVAGKEPQPTLAFLRRLARDSRAYVQGSRTTLGDDGRARNLATIIGPGGDVIAEYAKVHPFSFGRETERFTGGDKVLTYSWTPPGPHPVSPPHSPNFLEVCPAVCYDLRFPELFRLGLLAGAGVYTIGANWPAARAGHWRALLIARAIENQAYVLGVNRTGSDPHLAYAGGSIAVGPKGDILGELGAATEVLSVEVDPGAVRQWRDTFPAWKDARLSFSPRSHAL